MAEKFDLVIIGGGPGGYVAGNRAAQLGKKTAVVESGHLGGICLNWGCIPTKALLHTAELYDHLRHAEDFGLSASEISVNWKDVIARSRDVAQRLSKGIEFLFNKYGVAYRPGRGRLSDSRTVEVTPEKGDPYRLEAEHIILATGARPRDLPGLEPNGTRVITSKEAMVLPSVPKRLVIIGAGAIGVEFAYLYSIFGSEVTLIEMMPQILPLEDEEIARELTRQFKKRKINVFTGTTVKQLQRQKTQVKVQTEGKHEEVIAADLVLVAVGLQGNVEDLGLAEVGVSVEKSWIKVDEFYRTSVANVYAIGDVIGPPALAHAASAEGFIAVEHLAGLDPEPQVASVGLTEKAALEAGYRLRTGKFPFRALGKSLATGNIEGFVKVVYDDKYGELLGMHIIGSGATDLISEAAVARKLETTYHELLKTVHPHPTLSEALHEATAVAFGESVNF
jgi:dihydrolipoamide dehydrogenase